MNIKRYICKDMPEAMEKIKIELGVDAVILNTRNIRKKGIFGFFQKKLIEVVVAYDNKSIELDHMPLIKQSPIIETPIIQTPIIQTPVTEMPVPEISVPQMLVTPIEKLEYVMVKAQEKLTNTSIEKENENESLKNLEKKIEQMNLSIANLSTRLNYNEAIKLFSLEVQEFFATLLEKDVYEEIALNLAQDVQKLLDVKENEFNIAMLQVLIRFIGRPSPIKLKESGRTVVMLVGSTGVGKTTTIAKLAADFMLNKRKSVGILTADVYRIAAYEQLKTYAEILNIPIQILNAPEDIVKALEAYEDKDIVIIDTPGKGLHNKEHEEEISKLISLGNVDEVHLVISAVNSYRSCKEIIKSHSFIKNYKLIISKLDENTVIGSIFNAISISQKPISYVTYGQNVPDNYEVVNAKKLINMIIKGEQYE